MQPTRRCIAPYRHPVVVQPPSTINNSNNHNRKLITSITQRIRVLYLRLLDNSSSSSKHPQLPAPWYPALEAVVQRTILTLYTVLHRWDRSVSMYVRLLWTHPLWQVTTRAIRTMITHSNIIGLVPTYVCIAQLSPAPTTPGGSADDCDSDFTGRIGSKKQKRGVLPKHATSVMRSWLFQHLVVSTDLLYFFFLPSLAFD